MSTLMLKLKMQYHLKLLKKDQSNKILRYKTKNTFTGLICRNYAVGNERNKIRPNQMEINSLFTDWKTQYSNKLSIILLLVCGFNNWSIKVPARILGY